MNFNFIKKIFKFTKIINFIYLLIFLIILLEILFQILVLTENRLFKKPILFFNPYCDQAYWNSQENSDFNDKIYEHHPILSLIKKDKEIPDSKIKNNNQEKKNQNLVFYGSSFIDHDLFIKFYNKEENYAVRSYGLDQIYLSYILTKHKHYGDLIVIGFLLEDLDRALFNKRNYNKIRYHKKNNRFILNDYPVDLRKKTKKNIYLYSFNFFKSIIFLISNDFDYKKSKCKINFKKDLFKYFIMQIKKESEILNQNLIFITFNFKEDIGKNDNWRYDFIKDFLNQNNIHHLDMKRIIETHMEINQFSIDKYYSKNDLHFNILANEIIVKELNNAIMQYK